MQFTITIIGRINVGKSTLFNKLTKTNDALINCYPGLTRDRKYGQINIKKENLLVVDTAGITPNPKDIDIEILKQTITAIKQANLILFVVNSQDGVMIEEKEIAKTIRFYQKKTIVIVNKSEKINTKLTNFEFYSLGFKDIHSISAINGTGINSLLKQYIIPIIHKNKNQSNKQISQNILINKKKEKTSNQDLDPIKIVVLGKPNVGKSTLINSFLKEKRLITHNKPGTTRDSIWVTNETLNKKIIFIDTAGIKKKNKKENRIDILTKEHTIKNIKHAHVVLIIIDATENISDYDISLCNIVFKKGKSIIIIINKCDLLNKEQKKEIKKNVNYKLRFLKLINIHYISAIRRIGLKTLLKSIYETYKSTTYTFNSSQLTKIMHIAIKKQTPPIIKGSKIKLKYAHPGGYKPLTIIIHGNKTKYLNNSYKKYLKNYFQDTLKLIGSSINLYFKENINPYKNY